MSDNPTKVSFPFHLVGPGTMTTDKQFSIYVSRTLDYLGKNQDMINYRVKMNREYQEHYNIMYKQLETIIAGSRAEGLTSVYENDMDTMKVYINVICADNVRHFIHNRNTTVFQTDRYGSYAGYTKLKLVKYEGTISTFIIKDSLFDNDSENTYLSSDLLVTTIAKGGQDMLRDNNTDYINFHERSGPSLPTSDREGYIHSDRVFAFRYVCPTLLHSFLTRPRPYNRPSCNELRDISVMDAHVVPVGHKGSNESHNEWRICFTKAGIYLIQRLNETETILYITLKSVSKILTLISKDVTSYVMKNIVLWLAELYPEEIFTEALLTYHLIQALRFLQKCVMANFLPSYMIPERNLLADRLDPTQKLKLTTFLSTLIRERGYLLLRCEKLRYGIIMLYREPDMTEEFRRRRDMVEKLSMLRVKIIYEKQVATGLSEDLVMRLMDTNGTNDIIDTALLNIECPELIFLLRQGCSAEAILEIHTERLRQLMS